jgi:isoleucyl-tRNA synthetase
MKFSDLVSKPDFPQLEKEVLEFWKENKIITKWSRKNEGGKRFVFYEGPPTANGKPHIGHMMGRSIKDLYPKFKNMKGFHTYRRDGWDCHGLPVEIEVQKSLDIETKKDVEEYGIKEFNQLCRESVKKYVDNWINISKRIGYFTDTKNAYWTMNAEYIESAWWIFKQLYEKGLFYKGYKVMPYSPVTGSTYSSHELAQGYQDVIDPSIFVKFEARYHKTGLGVGVVIENEEGEVLMLLRGEEGREKTWGVVGGKLDTGETDIVETAKREILEEIGVSVSKVDLFGSSVDFFEGRLFHTHHVKAYLPKDTEIKLEEGSFLSYQWVKLEDLFKKEALHIPTRRLLEDYVNNFHQEKNIIKSDDENIIPQYIELEKMTRPKVFIVAWTTTPWTLPGNVALAINKDEKYLLVQKDGEFLVVAKKLAMQVMGEDFLVHQEFPGKELVGVKYNPLFFYRNNLSKIDDPDPGSIRERDQQNSKVILMNNKGELLVTTEAGKDYKTLPGGGVEKDESPLGAAVREVGEELGLEISESDLEYLGTATDPRSGSIQNFFILIHNDVPGNLDQKEVLKTEFISAREYHDNFGYNHLIDILNSTNFNQYKIYAADFVSMEDGTGVVHTAVAYGIDDYELGQKYDLGMLNFIDLAGKFTEETGDLAGLYCKDPKTERLIINKLKSKNRLFKETQIKHSYPHCWRTKTPLIYYPVEAWFIGTTKEKQKIIDVNSKINWEPEFIGYGRMGNWLESMVDWNISRNRFWGTPIPVWANEDLSEMYCVGSFEELKDLALDPDKIDLDKNEEGKIKFDPHRPFIDDIKIRHPDTGNELTRIPYIADVWFDSGAMPYAQNHYPFEKQAFYPFPSAEIKNESIDKPADYPADFICEAIDQTRGWFYTLEALSGLLFNEVPFKNVVVTDHGLDEKGKKQSKSLGNVVDPNEALDMYGADSLRWLIFSKDATRPMRISLNLVKDSAKELLLPYFSAVNFYRTYSNIDGFVPEENLGANFKPRIELDRWILFKLSSMIKNVDDYLEKLKISKASDEIITFLDDLNNWYIRINRKRFWKSGNDVEKIDGYKTLWVVLFNLTKVLAPFTPFATERVFQEIKRGGDPESVHLSNWPRVVFDVEDRLIKKVDAEKIICSIIHSARAKSKIKLRQPLSRVKIFTQNQDIDLGLIASEANFKEVLLIERMENMGVGMRIRPRADRLAQRFKAGFDKIQQLIASEDYFLDIQKNRVLIGENMKTETTLFLAERKSAYTLDFLDFDFEFDIQDPFFVAGEFNTAICLVDSTITDELKQEGFARELVRKIQDQRKAAGFDVSDRINVRLNITDEFVASAVEKFQDYIKEECLIKDIRTTNEPLEELEVDACKIGISVEKSMV